MQRVIVTVRRADEAKLRDLEVPADLDAGQLANMVAEALRWQSSQEAGKASYTIEAHPLGRVMLPNETLAGAGVWDGSWLVFHPVTAGVQGAGPVSVPDNASRNTPQFVQAVPTSNIVPSVMPMASPLPLSPPAAPPPRPYAYTAPEQAAPPQPAMSPVVNVPGVGDMGAWGNPSPVAPQPSAPTVTGWRSLGLDIPPLSPVEQSPPPPQVDQPTSGEKPKASSFVWKQVDE